MADTSAQRLLGQPLIDELSNESRPRLPQGIGTPRQRCILRLIETDGECLIHRAIVTRRKTLDRGALATPLTGAWSEHVADRDDPPVAGPRRAEVANTNGPASR